MRMKLGSEKISGWLSLDIVTAQVALFSWFWFLYFDVELPLMT